jgi:type II secretion system protein H
MKKKNGFSLIEMLAVLFIIGIILAIVVPMFGPMTGTTKVKTAIQNLADAMDMAQQHAITMGQLCHMLFPINTGNANYDRKYYKIVRETAPSTYITIGKVESLPKGIEVDDANSVFPNSINVPFPDDSSANMSLRYITFKTNGGIVPGGLGSDGHIQLEDVQSGTFQKVYFYNTARKVRIEDLGV